MSVQPLYRWMVVLLCRSFEFGNSSFQCRTFNSGTPLRDYIYDLVVREDKSKSGNLFGVNIPNSRVVTRASIRSAFRTGRAIKDYADCVADAVGVNDDRAVDATDLAIKVRVSFVGSILVP